MDRVPRSRILRLAGGLLFSAAFPLAVFLKFGGDPRFLAALAFGFIRLFCAFFSDRVRFPRAPRAASWIITVVFGIVVLTGILITPFSSYAVWLENVQQGEGQTGLAQPGGTVSNILILLTCLFSGVFAGMFLGEEPLLPIFGMAMVVLFLLSFVYQARLYSILFGAAVAACLIYLTVKHGRRGHRLRLLLLYVQLLAAACLLAVGSTQLTGGGAPRGSALVDGRLYPFLRQAILEVLPSYPLIYSIPGYGYSFGQTGELGGKVVLSAAPLFEVRGGGKNRLYLKTRIYDTYNGKSWQTSMRTEEADLGFLVSSTEPAEQDIDLLLLAEYYSLLPFSLDTVRIRFPGELPAVQEGDRRTGYVLKRPIKQGTVFHLQIGGNESLLEDSEPYLQVPTDLPEEIHFLAERLAQDSADAAAVLHRIEQYLAANYAYDLEAEMRGGYDDFVRSFLFEKLEGYCVHFATSFVVLARLSGIPARYATGFLLSRDDPAEPTTITGYASHAWPEVWLDGRGWTNWEATPALNLGYYRRTADAWIYALDMEFRGLTARQLESILGSVRPSEWVGPRDRPAFHRGFLLLLLIPLLGGALLWRLAKRRRKPPSVFRAERINRPLARLMRRTVRRMGRRGIPMPEAVGWVRWAASLSETCPRLSKTIHGSLGVILECMYAGRHIRPQELRSLRRLYGRLTRKAA